MLPYSRLILDFECLLTDWEEGYGWTPILSISITDPIRRKINKG